MIETVYQYTTYYINSLSSAIYEGKILKLYMRWYVKKELRLENKESKRELKKEKRRAKIKKI